MNKNLDIIKEILSQNFKENKEYKMNAILGLMADFFLFSALAIFLYVYTDLSTSFLNWDYLDFLLGTGLAFCIIKLRHFHLLRYFKMTLLSGKLAYIRTKPVNALFFIGFDRLNGAHMITTINSILITLVIIYFGNYSNLMYSFLLFIFALLFYIYFSHFFQSIVFFIKDFRMIFNPIDTQVQNVVSRFTPKLFENYNLSFLLHTLPLSVGSYMIVVSLKGNVNLFMHYFPYLILLLIFFIMGTKVLWYYGLKKYEAFG